MPMKNHLPRSEESIFGYLSKRDGEPAFLSNMATVFGCSASALTQLLIPMEAAGKVRRSLHAHKAAFFVPTAEFLQKEADMLARAQPKRTLLRIDKRFAEIYTSIAAQRQLYPSIG